MPVYVSDWFLIQKKKQQYQQQQQIIKFSRTGNRKNAKHTLIIAIQNSLHELVELTAVVRKCSDSLPTCYLEQTCSISTGINILMFDQYNGFHKVQFSQYPAFFSQHKMF